MKIPFNELKSRVAENRSGLDAACKRVLDSGWFLMGPETRAFEAEFAATLGPHEGVAVNSGTDAISLALQAMGLGAGDEVILPALTAPPCYHAVLAAGCVPVFAEVEEFYYTLRPQSVAALTNERTRAVLAVHLYGQPCDMGGLAEVCRDKGLKLLEDCAQSHGAAFDGRPAGSFGDAAAFSFYPTKNLGALGDAGMITTPDPEIARKARMLRQYGEEKRYVSTTPGANSRMDEFQAAFLRALLPGLTEANAKRRALADLYDQELADTPLLLPGRRGNADHAFHLYVVQAEDRAALCKHLSDQGVGTAIHYPVPGHLQPMFASGAVPCRHGELSLSEAICNRLLSLPMYPGLSEENARRICHEIKRFFS